MGDAEILRRVAATQGVTVEQLQKRLRDVEAHYASDPNACAHCEDTLSVSVVGRGGKYCGVECRKAAQRERDREKKA